MKESASVLVIEDHRDIAEMIISFLESKGYTADYASDGVTGLHLAVTQPFDLIVLDLSLPGMDGLEVCKQFRQQAHKDTPVIMLTARDTVPDKITGLNVGADDYLVKPFAMLELEARIRAQLRRTQGKTTNQSLAVGSLTFNPSTLEVKREGQTIVLTPIGLKLLEVLMKASPGVVSKREIERQVWGSELPDSDTLRSHMYTLRKKIDKPFSTPMINNLPGSGYQLVAND